MIVEKLLDHFDSRTELQIDVNDVREFLIKKGVQDEIRFHFVKMDKDKIRGILYRYTKHVAAYGEPIFCSEIVIAKDQGDEQDAWYRLVAVKELLHITDCTNITAESEEAVDNLFKAFSLPPDLRDSDPDVSNKRSVLNDRMRTYIALAILVPKACRDTLRELYKRERITDDEIAIMAGIPVRYSSVVMLGNFDDAIAEFIEWERSKKS